MKKNILTWRSLERTNIFSPKCFVVWPGWIMRSGVCSHFTPLRARPAQDLMKWLLASLNVVLPLWVFICNLLQWLIRVFTSFDILWAMGGWNLSLLFNPLPEPRLFSVVAVVCYQPRFLILMITSLNPLLYIVVFLPGLWVANDSHPQTLLLQPAYSALDVQCHHKELTHWVLKSLEGGTILRCFGNFRQLGIAGRSWSQKTCSWELYLVSHPSLFLFLFPVCDDVSNFIHIFPLLWFLFVCWFCFAMGWELTEPRVMD